MVYKNKLLTVSASILSTTLMMSQPLLAQTLTEAVDKTIQSNPTILAETNRRLSVDKTVDQARAGYYPKVDLNLGIGRERAENNATRPGHETLTRGEAGLSASQMLYDGFATKSAVEQSQSLAESAGFGVADTAETTSLRAIQVYLDVLRRQDLLSLTEDNLESHEKIHSQIQQRADSGVGNKADVEQTKARLALSQANVTATKGNLEDAQSSYLRVIGNLPESPVDPGDECCDKAPATLDDAMKIAYNQHPALRSAIAGHEAALAQEQGAEAPFHPRVDLELGTRADNNLDGERGHEKEALAMVRMRYNLLNGGADKARIEETGFLSEQAKETANIAKREIENDVRLAWNALDTISSRLPILAQRVKSAEKTRDAYQQQFNLGQRTLLDLLDTENEVLTARTDYTNAYYDQIYACYWLSETMGKLLEVLELKAPEQAITVAGPDKRSKEETAVTTDM
ncbi:TolC family outer membrane protein [Methylophaga sp. OBS4]|uniref:TolC family outer membrane protein n=1 Tax=Methylophaga sp. OBS4 TaxID=2991935 RepID=UPI002254328E|nr:TolC family outer membrane protein [Methylophaga sp. OBS4]MCX4187499.1 TolC family outer membrane protein [Methylophaga sp. OBS4]